MKKSKKMIRYWLLPIICCLPFFSCLFPTQPSKEIVRPAVKLSQSDFPDLAGATEARAGERPTLWEFGDEPGKSYVIKFSYFWRLSAEDFLDVDLIVAESREQAIYYLNYRRENSSIPIWMQPPEDKPPVVGNISYNGGSDFIRDNILVETRAYGILKEKTTAIVKQIDALLLTSRTASSAERFKPNIEKFQIVQNPVPRGSTTRLIIDVKDPLGGKLFYEWRFIPSDGNYGGIVIDEFGNYFYYAETDAQIEKLILFAINEGGFFSKAEIDIKIK